MDKEEFLINKAATTPTPLKLLRKMYLLTHALSWIEITPDDPRRRTKEWEEWPGRCEICHDYEFKLQRKYQRLIRDAKKNEGIFCLSNGMKGNTELIELARKRFGPRCAVCRLDYDRDYNRQVLGANFAKGLEDDRRQAIKNRGPALAEEELAAWELSKAWAIDLNQQLESQGYTYDPTAVEFLAFGEDWCGCAATFPIHMGRAFGLAKPVERRFDLINPDCSRMLLKAKLVEQNLPMPEHIRLFIFKTKNEPPTWGRYVAQYWEGIHGIIDRPHLVEVDFPPDSVKEINLDGVGVRRALMKGIGFGEELYGHIVMSVGCGGHTKIYATSVMAEEHLSLETFRAALLAGKVSQKI